jgi:predicted metal-dependent hydrolase
MSESLVVDNITFELRRSPRRKTLGITIDRGGELILNAPVNMPLAQIEPATRQKLVWLYTKLAEKDVFPQPPAKEFVSGESLWYLGRNYRLVVVDAAPHVPALRLSEGRFLLRRDERSRALEHFVKWYIRRGQPWLQRHVDLFAGRVGAAPQAVEIRDLGFRWGSAGKGTILYFHWRTLLLPPRIIDYLVVHELVHLLEPHHGTSFWQRVERVLPDFAARQQWLAEHGAEFGL